MRGASSTRAVGQGPALGAGLVLALEGVQPAAGVPQLPCEQALSLVVSTTTGERSPLQNAVKSMVDKNNELQNLIGLHSANLHLNVNPLYWLWGMRVPAAAVCFNALVAHIEC